MCLEVKICSKMACCITICQLSAGVSKQWWCGKVFACDNDRPSSVSPYNIRIWDLGGDLFKTTQKKSVYKFFLEGCLCCLLQGSLCSSSKKYQVTRVWFGIHHSVLLLSLSGMNHPIPCEYFIIYWLPRIKTHAVKENESASDWQIGDIKQGRTMSLLFSFYNNSTTCSWKKYGMSKLTCQKIKPTFNKNVQNVVR